MASASTWYRRSKPKAPNSSGWAGGGTRAPQLAQRSDESRSWHFQQITASCPAAQTEKDSPQLQEPEAMGFLNSKPVFIRPFL